MSSLRTLIDEETWAGMMHLPDDVAVRNSDHNGIRLKFLRIEKTDGFGSRKRLSVSARGRTLFLAIC